MVLNIYNLVLSHPGPVPNCRVPVLGVSFPGIQSYIITVVDVPVEPTLEIEKWQFPDSYERSLEPKGRTLRALNATHSAEPSEDHP